MAGRRALDAEIEVRPLVSEQGKHNTNHWGMMMATYIAGPMSGIEDYNHPAFHAKAAELRAAGEEVINPADADAEIGLDQPWDTYLRRDLVLLATRCDKIVLLPGWERSKGASLEKYVGEQLGMTIVHPDGRVSEVAPAGAAALAAHREVFAA